MSWLERAAQEFSEKAQDPTIKTIKTQVSEVLEVPGPSISQKIEGRESTRPLPPNACATCAHYAATPGKAADGWCRKHRTETWGAYTGGCAADWTPADPATRARERRRAALVARLEADPALRYSFDVANATPTAPAGGPVSVLLGLRMADGNIVTGELTVPAERWDMAAFIAYWAAQGRPS
jgi:hypothetical protein